MSRHKFGIQVYTGEYIFIVLNQLILRLFYYTSIKVDQTVMYNAACPGGCHQSRRCGGDDQASGQQADGTGGLQASAG